MTNLVVVLAIALAHAAPSDDFNRTLFKRAGSVLFRKTTFTSGSSMLSSFKPEKLWGEDDSMSVVPDPAGGSGRVLRVFYAKGSYSVTKSIPRGAGFYAPVTSPRTSMKLTYDVYFSNNFDFVRGGKLPGLWGGSTTCTGGRQSDDCFTTRFMWREGGQGEVYAYIPRNQRSGFCDASDVVCDFDYGNSLGRGKWRFQKGRWQRISQYVRLNTPGKMDGYIRVDLDGKKVYEMRNVSLRTKDAVKIRGIVFSTFFGGSSSTSWASKQNCYTYYKNFVLSTA